MVDNVTELVRFTGSPEGPPLFVPQLGIEVKTFTDEQAPKTKSGIISESLKWHVPLKMRGEFRPEDLANYDPSKKYRTDQLGYLLCYGVVKSGARKCKNRAVNRFSRCESHGGKLHPLDKIAKEKPPVPNPDEGQPKSRYKAFLAGELTIADLDDEELATCSFRASNGRLYKPKNVPREMAHAFTRAIFDRAQAEMRSHTVTAAKTMAEIMVDKTNDPEVRLKAAKELLERNLGKTPQVLAITAQAPWEEIFDGIASGSRESSRSRRQKALPDNTIDAIDAEVVDEQNSDAANDKGDKGFDNTSGENRNQQDANDSGSTDSSGQDNSGNLPGIDGSGEPSFRDSRHFDRNPAILAQTLEIPPDQGLKGELPDPTTDFDKLPEPDEKLIRQYIKLPDGSKRIRHVLHIYNKEFQLGTEFITEPKDND